MSTINPILAPILAGMLEITPEAYRPAADSERMHTYEDFAQDFHAAASTPIDGLLPFTGPAATEATEEALAAIASNESSYRQSVRDCTKKGDNGNSISAYQLYRGKSRQGHKEKEICEDPVLAARLAIGVLNWYTWVPKIENLFAGYARGTTTEPNFASQTQTNAFNKLIKLRNIRVYRKKGEAKLYAEFLPEEVVDLTNAEPIRSSSR